MLGAIERLRRRVRELNADLHRVNSSPFPSRFAKENARQIIETLASQAPSVAALVDGQQHIGWPMKSQRVQILNASERIVEYTEEAPDALAILCWLHRDQLIAALDAEIEAESDDAAALSIEAREVQAAEIQGDLLSVEREECELVWRALRANLPTEFRQDCSLAAVLGAQLITVPMVEERGGSSVGHSFSFLGLGRRRTELQPGLACLRLPGVHGVRIALAVIRTLPTRTRWLGNPPTASGRTDYPAIEVVRPLSRAGTSRANCTSR